MEAKVRGEVTIFKFLSVRVDMRLQEGNGIRKLGRLDRAEEKPTASPIVVVEVTFRLDESLPTTTLLPPVPQSTRLLRRNHTTLTKYNL